MAGFYSARGRTIPPLPWPTFAPPLSALAENRNGYCVFTTVHTEERDTRFQWVEPLLISYNYLVKSADSDVQAATLEEARQYLVGTQLGDYTADLLENLQFKRIDRASDINVTLNKLLLGRIDLMPMAGTLVDELRQKVMCSPILDHPAGEFPGGNTHGGPDAPEAFMSDIGGLLPIAL